jgi:D-hexose-6-phosphate mutarotase
MTETVDDLNDRFALPGQLHFRADPGGLIFADFDTALAEARLCLQGGHLVSWRPREQAEPVVWVSSAAKYAAGKSIRGGVPICWPWFGPHAEHPGYPGHGFARTVPWEVVDSAALDDGTCRLDLTLLGDGRTQAQWPHPCRLELAVTVGTSLTVELTTHNTGSDDFVIGEALHTYFRIGEIGSARVDGLDGCVYVDKTAGGERRRQEGPIQFTGEVDRVYLGSEATCTLVDPELGRRIRIDKQGSQSTVVWTPWREKADKMGDFGPGAHGQGGWREMVCVESGNALDDVVRVPAGGRHTLAVTYRAEPL